MKIGHVHLKIRNLEKSLGFYQGYLDMKVTELVNDRLAFMSTSDLHHELALQELSEEAPLPKRHGVGLYHVAFEVPDKKSLVETYQKLKKGGVSVYPVDHRISWALYFSDPDGNGIEVYWDTRKTQHGADLWEGRNLPLPAELLN